MGGNASAVIISAGLENVINNYHVPTQVIKTPESEHKIEDVSKESLDRASSVSEPCTEFSKTSLDITFHKATGDVFFKVISDVDGKVIREIPFEELFHLEANLEEIAGLLSEKKGSGWIH